MSSFAIWLAMDPKLATCVDAKQMSSAPIQLMRRCSLRFFVRLILPAADPDEDNQRAGDTTCAKEEGHATNCYLIVDMLRYTWYLRPNTILEQNWIVYETNSFGLRDVEFSLVKPEGTLRIVCLGDSVTYGGGFSFEET